MAAPLALTRPRYELRKIPVEVSGSERLYGKFDTFTQRFDITVQESSQSQAALHVSNSNLQYERDHLRRIILR